MPPRRRPLRPDEYQSRDDAIRAEAEVAQEAVRRGMRRGFKLLRTALPTASLQRLLEQRNYPAVVALVPWADLETDVQDVFVRLGTVAGRAADKARAKLNLRDGDLLVRPFDRVDPVFVNALLDQRATMVRDITGEARASLQAVLVRGINAWRTPQELTQDIRDTIGLTTRQSAAVLNYRSMLETADPGALDRRLRAPQFDRLVQQAIDDGEALPSSRIDQLVERYADRYLDYRANMIARTETIQAANRGARLGLAQLVDRGVLHGSEIRRYWLTALDETVCDICSAIPVMNEEGVGVDESFETPDGPMIGPEDSHTACRCTETAEVVGANAVDREAA